MRGSAYRRCPPCEESNPAGEALCFQCGADIGQLLAEREALADRPATDSPLQDWETHPTGLLRGSLKLYGSTFWRLARLAALALGVGCAVILVVTLVGGILGPLFPLALFFVGLPALAAVGGSAISSYLVLLADACRGLSRPWKQLWSLGLARGFAIGASLVLAGVFLCTLLSLSALFNSGVPLLLCGLLALFLWVAGFCWVPVVVLELRTPLDALGRALEMTAGHRRGLVLLASLQGGSGLLLLWAFEQLYELAAASGNLVMCLIILLLGTFGLSLLGAWTLTLTFVFYWKSSRGRNLVGFEDSTG